jgi:hypothetical protein
VTMTPSKGGKGKWQNQRGARKNVPGGPTDCEQSMNMLGMDDKKAW